MGLFFECISLASIYPVGYIIRVSKGDTMLFHKVPSISWEERDPKIKIIDVREPHEYQHMHAPKAVNVPLHWIATLQSESPVYVVCASGVRSRKAVKILRKHGIDAINIKGGMMRYGS